MPMFHLDINGLNRPPSKVWVLAVTPDSASIASYDRERVLQFLRNQVYKPLPAVTAIVALPPLVSLDPPNS